jgi:Rps23 Pro-64 3,4-dihydroxylase Tpa1-like proline 4-hydroxylase
MTSTASNPFIEPIKNRLLATSEEARQQFQQTAPGIPTRFFAVEDLLPKADCLRIYEAFPADFAAMREMKSLKEHKFTSKNFDEFARILHDISMAFQSEEIIAIVEKITGIEQQVGDPQFYAGGLSMMGQGNFLNPHIDNSHDSARQLYRTLNLLYYVTPDWNPATGGNLELWDKGVRNNTTIESRFNRLVVMETNPWSWHSVSPITENKRRCCVSNYYFSPKTPTGEEHFHVTSFNARPEQPVRRLLMHVDTFARMLVRKVFKVGIGKKDLYPADGKQ